VDHGYVIRHFGDYEIQKELGRGGMGVVYQARQTSLNRPVALKMLKAGVLADRAELRRFQNEAEAVALLDHPGIVPLYEVGEQDGQKYFSMKLVAGCNLGETLARFMDDPRTAAAVVAETAEAVHHAHMRGVLHRDLKPANILIDSEDRPHVTDFGLAKRIEAGVDFTASGAILGTPAYMSPEQASPRRGNITIATDVYGLGAVLYALVTGKAPFGGDSAIETLDAVRNREPEPPSKLNARVPRDLDNICLKCLEKDPRRRYASAQALSDDLRAWLGSRPISARHIGLAERAWLWSRRRPAIAVLSAGVLLATIGGAAATIAVQASSNRALASKNVALIAAIRREAAATAGTTRALQMTQAAEATARVEAENAQAVNEFLAHDLLEQAEPANNAVENKVTLREVLDRAAAKVGARFTGRPDLEASLRSTIANTYESLGSWDRAEAQWRAVLTIESLRQPGSAAETKARMALGHALDSLSRSAEAIPLLERSAADLRRMLGPEHPDTLAADNFLGLGYLSVDRFADGIALLQKTRNARERTLGLDHPDTLASRNNLGNAYRYAGRDFDAMTLYEETLKLKRLKLGADHPNTLTVEADLADVLASLGQMERAIALHEDVLNRERRTIGADHPNTLITSINLCAAYAHAGRPSDAIALGQETLKIIEPKLGQDHQLSLTCRSNLAFAYSKAARLGQAIAMYKSTIDLMNLSLGPDHYHTLIVRGSLASVYRDAGRIEESIASHRQIVKLMESKIGVDHPYTINSRNELARACEADRRWAVAEPIWRDSLRRRRKVEKPDSEGLAVDLAGLGNNLLRQSKWSESEPFLRECLAIREKIIPDNWRRFNAMSMLGGALLGLRRYAEAEPLLLGGYDGIQARQSAIAPESQGAVSDAASRVVRLYDDWGRPEKARAWKTKRGLMDLPAAVFAR
jgi:tetratricopeptide (TPR) repeat protein/predicted Ser/Thr protein kinase